MKQIHEIEIMNLIEKAKNASERSYSPYSHYSVGACLKGASGAYYMGTNVENASFGATICAERGALVRAIYEGDREFDALCVYADSDNLPLPCGICLQMLSEFCESEMPVICAGKNDGYKMFSLGELIPNAFVLDKK